MKRLTSRLTSLALLAAALSAGPASAMRTADHLDADQRGQVTLPVRHAIAAVTLPAPPEAAPADDNQLPTQEQQARAAATTPVASPVPEPSGWIMVACGLLLLLLSPYSGDEDAITPEPPRHS